MDRLAQEYLVHHCYNAAAISLSKEMCPSSAAPDSLPGSTIHTRQLIKHFILNGNVDEAIYCIKRSFPSVLDTNNLLCSKLLRLSLIEKIRRHKTRPVSEVTEETERDFLNSTLAFVHENILSTVVSSRVLFEELELTMSLLCFKFDPLVDDLSKQPDFPDELKHLFSTSLRTQCYVTVNAAILHHIRCCAKASGTDSDFNFTNSFGVGSTFDGQTNEYYGPSYGVGLQSFKSPPTPVMDRHPAQQNDSLQYRVKLSNHCINTTGLDRIKQPLEPTQHHISERTDEPDSTEMRESTLERIIRIQQITDRLRAEEPANSDLD